MKTSTESWETIDLVFGAFQIPKSDMKERRLFSPKNSTFFTMYDMFWPFFQKCKGAFWFFGDVSIVECWKNLFISCFNFRVISLFVKAYNTVKGSLFLATKYHEKCEFQPYLRENVWILHSKGVLEVSENTDLLSSLLR